MRKVKIKNNPHADLLHQKHIDAEIKRKKKLKKLIQETRNKKPIEAILPIYSIDTNFKELSRNLILEYKLILERKQWQKDNTISGEYFLSRKKII